VALVMSAAVAPGAHDVLLAL
jgi:hypothetical protein